MEPKTLEEAVKIIKNQNKYITELEAKNKAMVAAVNNASDNVDNDVAKTVYEMRSEKYQEQATQVLIEGYGQKVFDAMKVDWDKWIAENVKHETATKELYVQSFQMVYGQAVMDKEHPVHKADEPDTQEETNEEINTAGEEVTSPLQIDREIIPPTMGNEEGGTLDPNRNLPPTQHIASTDDAMKHLRSKINSINAGNDPYDKEY